MDFAKQSDTVQDRCRKNAERNVVEMNLPSNHPYLYEINKNVIEEFTVPALLIDLNMNVVAKNLRARRYLRTLRLGNTIRGVVSEGDVEEMQRMKIGERMRISLLVVGDMFGGIVQRCYDCYAVKVMTSNTAMVKRLMEMKPDLGEKNLLEYFDFGEAFRDDPEFRSAIERLFAKREKYVVKLSWQVGQFLRVFNGLNRVYYDASNLNMLVRDVERSIVKIAPMIASRFSCAYRTQNCWALLDKRDFQSALMLMIEFAYTYMAGRVVNVDLCETVNTFFLCVNFDCALPRPLIEAMCRNDFEDPAFGKKYGDLFFPLAAIKLLCQLYSLDFAVCAVGGTMIQLRLEGDTIDVSEENLIGDPAYEKMLYAISAEQERLLRAFFADIRETAS